LTAQNADSGQVAAPFYGPGLIQALRPAEWQGQEDQAITDPGMAGLLASGPMDESNTALPVPSVAAQINAVSNGLGATAGSGSAVAPNATESAPQAVLDSASDPSQFAPLSTASALNVPEDNGAQSLSAITAPSNQIGTKISNAASEMVTKANNPQGSSSQTAQQLARLKANKEVLANPNVSAYLKAIASAEGGGYDFKYGAFKGKKNDPWRFTDFSTHPGTGLGGVNTAAGMYQITKDTWTDHGEKMMGLTDFTPATQDLIAVDMLRRNGTLDKIMNGDIAGSMSQNAPSWSSLPQGPGMPGYWPKQPYLNYQDFLQSYKNFGGTVK
jgi:muramidase (phage lysozyme)